MAWEQLSINKPHLVYIILGGFTSLFMLCSSIIKERLYIGEATVATLCGIIFGPHAANLINPNTWGNTDQITEEFSRIVLVVQCFAVGVELPKAYMEKHWRSVVFLLVPVMTFGWLITSLFIWGLFGTRLNWLDSLVCAACVTATDPVLASSVVGKGKFAKRVPKHLRDLLSAESGCNDGMAFPFIYLGIYITRYMPDANTVSLHWFCNTILYECIWGATYGVIVGYAARRAIRYAHERDLIDRESFLVFYFVLALFCAGSGSLLGMDDLLIGFSCGVGFSNDGWFLEKTEEAHVSNVIDLLINLAFFVYFGTIIPWAQYNSDTLGIPVWKLVVLGLLVLFFRRIPIMLALKPLIPDIKTWREALFAGHFGPIGVGAIFVAILARAELEHEGTTPLAHVPEPGSEFRNIIVMIWPITTFLVITSIVVHGSSIAVFTLGKHINTLTITMSYTQANDEGNWMDRLPRIQSRSKSSMSIPRTPASGSDTDLEKASQSPTATLGVPKNFLRRQKEEDTPNQKSSLRPPLKRKKWDTGIGPGGPIEKSAIGPQPQKATSPSPSPEKSGSDSTAVPSPNNEEDEGKHFANEGGNRPQEEVFQEGNDTIIEDEEGNVLEVMRSRDETDEERAEHAEEEVKKIMSNQNDPTARSTEHEAQSYRPTEEQPSDESQGHGKERHPARMGMLKRLSTWSANKPHAERKEPHPSDRRHGPARAFKFGNTIIVEDEDGEVIKKYDIPPPMDRKGSYVDPEKTKQRLQKMGKWMGMSQQEAEAGAAGTHSGDPVEGQNASSSANDDERIRFTVGGSSRRMSKADFIRQIQSLDPKSRANVVEDSDAPERVKQEARKDAKEHDLNMSELMKAAVSSQDHADEAMGLEKLDSRGSVLTPITSQTGEIPTHSLSEDLKHHSVSTGQMSAAERRRQAAAQTIEEEDSDDDGTERVPPRRAVPAPNDREHGSQSPKGKSRLPLDDQEETAAERRRREGALGLRHDEEDSDEDESHPRQPPRGAVPAGPPSSDESSAPTSRGIRFADQAPKFANIRWAGDGSKKGK